MLRDDLASYSTEVVEIRIPQLGNGLVLPPALVNKQGKNDAGPVFAAARLLRSLDDSLCDDATVGLGDLVLFKLTGYALFDQVV